MDNFYLKIITEPGAFGEVRKAVHKASGMMRAVKIINKASTSKEE